MEALHSRLTTGEQSGGQEHSQPESPHRGPQPKSPSQHCQQQQAGSQKTHDTSQQSKQSRRQHPERKRLRHQRQSIETDTALEGKHADAPTTTKTTRVPCLSPGAPASSAVGSTQTNQETQEGTPKQKRERKPQRPGKYVCTYCGRACAKPSVLQKHIRSHTGERPYPCAPCGFSFKTKSNLYKHRKSHTHRVKAGLVFGEPRSLEEHVTESEDETRQLSSASSNMERQSSVASLKSHDTDRPKDHSGGMDDSYAVKKRLAMRLSRGKHGPLDSSDEKTSSLILGSRGSTESGYFSRSESTEQSQDSPPNTSAKSYAEIILGKYGRLGQLQRMSRHHNQQPSGQEEKNIPFSVPKKQVIDHITKLITINEAVVDTSKIDSVKPRRFSLSRKSSTESQKGSSMKEPVIHSPKAGDLGYKNSGSITMGVPCEKFHHQSLNVEPLAGQTSIAPLLRSHSMPSAASSIDASSGSSNKFRLSQSFDERQSSRRYGMLRRQPAIEIPLAGELPKEEHQSSHSFYHDSITTVPDHKQSKPEPYECEACGTGCKDWEGYKTHKQSSCLAHHPVNASEVAISQMDRPQLINHPVRPGPSAMRKRRKEESFEFDDSSSLVASSSPSLAFSSGQCIEESKVAYEGPRRPTLQTCSVIQHTSSFEKQETLCTENQGTEAGKGSPPHEEYKSAPQKQPQQQSSKPTPRKLVRQHNVLVPEILVTEDSNMNAESLTELTSTSKQSEKLDEFQWPQRSPSLAQLPIEKLPPKKKRLRLAEAAQSSGESSFESISLPRSPSQDSSASYASSRSTSFEESNRLDMEIATSTTPLRRSRAPHMLTVPGVHQHREMRRSASEQAPHDPQQGILMAETRSKSFDYSCLSPERSAVGWRERRKCLLMRHSAVRDPEEEEEDQSSKPNPSLDPVSPTTSSRASPSGVHCSRSSCSPLSGDTVLCNPTQSTCKELFSQWKLNQNIQLTGSTDFPLSHIPSVGPLKEVASHVHTGQPPGVSLQLPQPYSAQGPSGAARAHYLPMSTGLKLEIPSQRHDEYAGVRLSPSHIQHSLPSITSSPELVRPPTSPAVAVRLQTDTLTPACAIYTTLSQTTPPSPQEPIDAGSHNTSVLTSEYISHSDINPDIHQWSVDGLRSSSSGGNKRMLSPSNSIELNPESQQQQKRVKEEEEREERCVDKSLVDTSNKVDKRENQSCLSSVSSPIRHIRPSFPSLLSSTCNSWCYLNYIKPNPSTLDEQKPSVYSSWSISGYDPNPPGLSSKTALSLLHCKQRLSPSIYTMSPMSVSTPESMEPDDSKRPCSTEVLICQSYRKDHEETREGHHSAKDNRSNKGEEEEDEKQQEEVQSSCRYKQPPQVWILEGGSNVKYGFAQRGGGGKYECEDCGFHCKNPSATQKHTHLHTESTPPVCRQCNFASKAKDNFNKNRRSKAHKAHGEESCYSPDDIDEGACEDSSAHPDEQKARKHSDLGGSGHADDSNDKNKKHDGGQKSKSSHSPGTASSHHEKPADPGGQIREPEPSQSLTLTPKDPTQKCVAGSASARRALFARRHLQPSTSAPSRGPSSPSSQSPRRESSPPRSPSPRPHQPPPSSLSPSGCHVSLSPLRPISPVRGLSPVTLQSHGSGSLGPSSSYTATSAQNQICLLPRGRAATARLSVDDTGPTHFTLHPGQPRGALKVLSHLPLHSQQPTRAPSLMIPIGGIHMIQPRSALPLYSLVSSPTPTQANPSPAGTEQSQRPADIPAGRLLLLQRQDTLKETGPCSQASPPGHKAPGETSGSGRLTGLPGRNGSRRECFGPQEPLGPGKETKPLPSDAKASTLHQEAADAHATQRCVYPQTAQGQKAPSSQTQL
ncbi:transcription factor HIVEP3 [Myripristis murdjan]|uniref:transcription factor HIVEP3 n=1 Tax=Myripristis murdjan TaxID=586833 RepID=UPI001176246E|nr:transcription factor HIVEP3-like [Myripristis murdjan]